MEMQKPAFKRVNGKVCYLSGQCITDGSGQGIILATPKDKQKIFDFEQKKSTVSEVTDQDLIKLWPHRTSKNHHGRNKTGDKIMEELGQRGFSSVGNNKWQKTVPAN